MKKRFVFPLFLAAAFAISAAEPRVSRTLLATAEKSFDGRVLQLWGDALSLVGPTRGVYLEGYGAVFTAEVNVATPSISLMNPTPTSKQIADLHKIKQERLPQLRAAMKSALMDMAASLDPVPASEQVVLALLLPRFPGENTAGLPLQLIMQGTKQKLLDAKRAGGSAADQAIKITEY
jgi:hypothetical protein